jgi:hypothetical protein
MPRHQDAGDARSLGTSQHRTEIARVGHPVAHQQERVLVFKQRLERNRLEPSGEGEDTLVTLGARFAVQASHGDNLHWHALSLCLEFNGVENVRRILGFGDVDALDRASTRLQEFEHGVATLDLFTAETFFVTSRRATRSADVTTHERAPALAW